VKVSLGTIEINDAQRKAIRKDLGKGGHATRDDVKEYLGSVIKATLKNAGSGAVVTMKDGGGDSLPEPTAAGDSTSTSPGGTSPSTGNLGSAGTPGGTI
jgi:hypothetical protein